MRPGASVTLGALALTLAGCVEADPPEVPTSGPAFSFEGFFEGATLSSATLKTIGGGERRLAVDGVGVRNPDGSFTLKQTIRWADGDVDRRTWRVRRVGEDRIEAEVEGVRGLAFGQVTGPTFTVSYTFDEGPGVRMQHWMTLQPDGGSVRNIAVGRVFGIPVARLDETFRRVEPTDLGARAAR